MNTIKLFFITLLLLSGTSQSLAQYKWDMRTEEYNHEKYTIKYNDALYVVTNQKYELSKLSGVDANYDDETFDEQNKRREPLRWKIYNVLNEVFNFNSIPVSRDELLDLTVVCYFDSKTKNYVGIHFIFNLKIKDYITLQKINLAEKKLLESNINAGETYLIDDRPYFDISVTIRVGQ